MQIIVKENILEKNMAANVRGKYTLRNRAQKNDETLDLSYGFDSEIDESDESDEDDIALADFLNNQGDNLDKIQAPVDDQPGWPKWSTIIMTPPINNNPRYPVVVNPDDPDS